MRNCCGWEEIIGFRSPREHQDFIAWIESQVADGVCEELCGVGDNVTDKWRDRLFRCVASGDVWKLSCPDPGYFAGAWRPVE